MDKIKIVFERITNPEVMSYEVLSNPPNTRIQDRVFVIDNPKDINPVRVFAKFGKNDNLNTDKYTQIFQLKHTSILLDEKQFLTVYLNGVEFDSGLVTINKQYQQVFMYYELKEGDIVEFQYYIDGVEFEFDTNYPDNTYTVKPMVDQQSSLIGKHSILL